ncbi:MAG: carbohydrate binding family 9 domain-containing protein, partial [Micropepsaceae bacterium]
LRLAYDNNHLYISIYAYDSEPDQIIATQKEFDGDLGRDDSARIIIDPSLSGRNAYVFEVNSLGGYVDALVQNNTDFIGNWNAIWQVDGKRVEDGWTGELAIPFRILSFDPADTDWGFDIYREIRRKNENVRWGLRPLGARDNDVSMLGTITGLNDMNQGFGLDVEMFGVARYVHYENGSQKDGATFRPSGNLYYKITPALTGLITVNTDFSDSTLDAVQVNTTRFSLFREETRQFFLQDAAAFEFGGRSFSTDGFDGGRNINNGRPFFSRNIGLVDGTPVSIVAGGKLSGQVAGFNVGALSVKTHNPRDGNDEILSVARISMPVFAESQLGFIVTNGDPTGTTTNTLLGADFQYANSNFVGTGNRILGTAFFLRNSSDVYGDDDEFGASILYPNEPWGGELHFKQIGENFRPALGFANRRGIREYRADGSYVKRSGGGPLRQVGARLQNTFITDLRGEMQSRESIVRLNAQRHNGDFFQLVGGNVFENVLVPFTLADSVVVPAGRYEWNHFGPRIFFSNNRRLSGNVGFVCCNYYNGTNISTRTNINWTPNETWGFQLSHDMDLIRLPTGSVDIHILEFNTNINITPRMNIGTTIQYDNISKQFNLLAQYRWEYEPGQTIFVAVGESATIESFSDRHYVSQSTSAVIRLGRTIQF